ncbi:MAG: HD domain-containing phosphohydrolase [Planctomycetota bacterium]
MPDQVRFSFDNLISALSLSLDLLTLETINHHRRVTLIAAQLAKDLKLSYEEYARTFYAALLHDVGVVSSNDKLNIMKFDYVDSQPHCERGNSVLQESALLRDLSSVVRHHHDRWLGPNKSGLIKDKIPLLSQIIYLADRLAVLISNNKYILEQKSGILNKIKSFSGTFFNPDLVAALGRVSRHDGFWLDLSSGMIEHQLIYFTPAKKTEVTLDEAINIARIFEIVVDNKSRYTHTHSQGVRKLSLRLAKELGLNDDALKKIEIAASLHDLGKLAVADEILEKPASLTPAEYSMIKKHSYYTYNILRLIDGFDDITRWSALHHERLDSSGYPFSHDRDTLPMGARIIAVADVFTALTEDRPYRRKLPADQAIRLIEQQVKQSILDGNIVDVLKKIMP